MIAIKGMEEIPKNCAECPMYNSDVDDYCDITGEWITGKEMVRHKDCPLIEIITCKDCKHREKVHPSYLSNKKDEVYFCTLQSDEYCYEVEDDHFCADGERRE